MFRAEPASADPNGGTGDENVPTLVLRRGLQMDWSAGPARRREQTEAGPAANEGQVRLIFGVRDEVYRPGAAEDPGERNAGWMAAIAGPCSPPPELEASEIAFHVNIATSRSLIDELFKAPPESTCDEARSGQPGFFEALPLLLPINPPARLAVEAIRRCPFAGAWRALLLEARGNDMLLALASALGSFESKPRPLMEDGNARIRAAAARMNEHLERSWVLSELAREVGLSETTLKRGFHQVFDTTVFAYLRNRRMEKARSLLQAGQATVLEAAVQVGYSNPSNFAAAFRRAFGMNPKEYQLATRR